MALEARFPLGLHEFFRYAIPGYIYLLVFLPPIFITGSSVISFQLFLHDQVFSSALLVLAGPLLGYVIYYVYYPIFWLLSYDYRTVPPFSMINVRISNELQEKRKKGIVFHRLNKEALVRAVEDILSQDISKSGEERVKFLFSSFHSLGASIVGICLGMVSWLILKLLDVFSGYTWDPVGFWGALYLFLVFSVTWVVVLILFLLSWKQRKDLAIMEENILIIKKKKDLLDLADPATRAYLESACVILEDPKQDHIS